MLAIATSWPMRGTDGPQGTVARVQAAGLRAVEIEYHVTEEEFGPLVRALQRAGIAIRSLHNFCPFPRESGRHPSGDLYDLASLDFEERALAVKWTQVTIRHAAELGARAVVLHLGAATAPAPAVHAALARGPEALRAAVAQHLADRAEHAPAHLEAVRKSLEVLDREAGRAGVRLGLETRVHLHEIPDEEETAWLLDALRGGVTGYWHDAGHARVREVLGVGTQRRWLERFGGSLVGMHLHDVSGIRDHLVPGQGEVDFERLAAGVPRDHEVLLTLELGPGWPVELVRSGVQRLVQAGFPGI